MDVRLSYIDATPDILDLLQNAKFALEGVGKLAEAVLGTSACVDGFTCTPTSPASLNVSVGPGQIYQQANLVAQPISALVADTHLVMKQGLLRDALALTLVPPTTPGFAQNVLIQAQYADDDTSATQVFNYYNAANPDVPLAGPGGTNQAQTLFHKGVAQVTAKYGGAATAGSQVAPTPDAGFVGLFVVTLAYGQTAITAGNIALYPGAPFIGTKLPAIPDYVKQGQVQRVVASAVYYVRPDGNDANDGSANTAGKAFATIGGALTATANIIATTGTLTIQLGLPGTYAMPGAINRPGGSLLLRGDPNNQGAYVVAGGGTPDVAALSVSGCALTISGVTLSNTTTTGLTLAATIGAQVGLDHVTFTAVAGNGNYHIGAFGGGTVAINAGVVIAASMGGWLATDNGGIVFGSGVTVTFANGPTWSVAGVKATTGGVVGQVGNPAVFAGAANGPRFFVTTNAVLNTNGSGVNYYPGSSAGTADTANGGRYV